MTADGTCRVGRDTLLSVCCLNRETLMNITISHLQPVVALIAGILILLVPRLLNYIVAIYLIVIGIIGLGIFR